MSSKPILLFLHGVGEGDPDNSWRDALEKSLAAVGYPGLDGVRVLAPKYPHTLRGSDDTEPLPPITVRTLSGEAAKANRRAFERRLGALEIMLGLHERGNGWFGGDHLVNAAAGAKSFIQAGRYLEQNSNTRAQVLNRVLRDLPGTGRIVIVGHSLGSVVAADVIRRLPVGLEVAGLVTVGSPLAHERFHVDKLRSTLAGPPTNLAWWVNFWSDYDPVTTSRGVSAAFPWMLDHRVDTRLNITVHNATTYLQQEVVATAIGFGLFGSQSKTLARTDQSVDISLDYAETVGLMALRYAHLLADELRDDKHARFTGALRQVQANTFDLIRERNAREGRPLASAVARIAVDLTQPDAEPAAPIPMHHLSKEDAVVPLVTIAAANVLQPFEIEISKEQRLKALQALTLEMGLGSQIGADVFTAADRARSTLKVGGGANWFKWIALGLGAAALIAATGGLAMFAAPGVAGAAAITSALAAFGPGGMIGGLLTAGTLVSAGGGSIALGLASSSTTAESLEAVVASQLSVAILRQLQGIEQDPATWSLLIETGIEVRRERSRLEVFSDESAMTLKELKRKLEAIDRALTYLTRNGLGPADAPAELDA